MSGFYTEADYENSVIQLFEGMGYSHVYGPDIERDLRSLLYEAYSQLRNYMQEIPSMFIYNAICVMSDMSVSKGGSGIHNAAESRFRWPFSRTFCRRRWKARPSL